MLNYVSGITPPLPSEYQEVEWIGASGTQYIDTGIIVTDYSRWELEFAINGTFWVNTGHGATTGAYNNQYIFVQINGRSNFQIAYASETKTTTTPYDENVKHTAIIDAKNLSGKFDYEDFTFSNRITITPIRSIFLFGKNFTSGMSGGARHNIYSSKIYENDVLIQDLVPCYRKSDDVIGMYDTVTQTFFTNQGTGTFTKGQDV